MAQKNTMASPVLNLFLQRDGRNDRLAFSKPTRPEWPRASRRQEKVSLREKGHYFMREAKQWKSARPSKPPCTDCRCYSVAVSPVRTLALSPAITGGVPRELPCRAPLARTPHAEGKLSGPYGLEEGLARSLSGSNPGNQRPGIRRTYLQPRNTRLKVVSRS